MNRPLRPQMVAVRPAHLETPHSYLTRLALANGFRRSVVDYLVQQRRLATGDPAAEGRVIAELGGPDDDWFARAHAQATFGMTAPRERYERQVRARTGCTACTGGSSASTYPHIRYSFCRRHGTWLGGSLKGQRIKALTAERWKCEQSARRLVSSGAVDEALFETAWELVRDNSYLTEGRQWSPALKAAHDQPQFEREVDDRLALFPVTVRVLQTVTSPGLLGPLRDPNLDDTYRRAHLYRAFAWLPHERWVLCEGIDQFFNGDRR